MKGFTPRERKYSVTKLKEAIESVKNKGRIFKP
jgi:hypothetical protein